ncbi:MAG: polymer-forming cytoskeletal protein [Bdellovibrionales bacterium]|nr:polymer-forming cytoskeletal protein [Bdellovibrionales bacterium]
MKDLVQDLPFWQSLEILDGHHWISHDFKGRGDFEFSGNLRLSGEWRGTIHSSAAGAQLHVLKSAVVAGVIRVDRLSVEGHLDDIDIEVEWLRIMPGARVSGRIRAKTLIVDEGALLQGRIVARTSNG